MYNQIINFKTNYTPNPAVYSTGGYECTRGIAIISYPRVKPNMYTINTNGEIYNIHTQAKISSYDAIDTGYVKSTLISVDGTPIPFLVHRLVAFHFCNPPMNFEQLTVNHIDGNRKNNWAGNLEWVTYAANNQHERYVLNNRRCHVANGRPIVNEDFVRYLCEQFVAGKSNTEIMRELGMTIDNANHTLLRDIRGGYTWTNITCQYNFDRSSKKHAYTKEQKAQIDGMILKGMTDYEVFKVMQGRAYNPSTDRLDSSYRSIQTRRVALRKKGYNV